MFISPADTRDFVTMTWFPVTPMTLPPHGLCSARQMMASACSQWAYNDHFQTKGQHMPAKGSLIQATTAKFLIAV